MSAEANFSEADTYLGDGAYYHDDGYSICLYTNNGLSITNQVWLEPLHVRSLLALLEARKQENVNGPAGHPTSET